MANINSTMPDIVVVNAVKNAYDSNIIDFVIENEYYLKKLSVGAHVIKVQSSPILKDLYTTNVCYYPAISYDNYIIEYNLTDNSEYDLKVILLNYGADKLIKGEKLFSIKIFNINKFEDSVKLNCHNNVADAGTSTAAEDEEQHVDENDLEPIVEDGSPTEAKRQKLDDVQQD
ncbi:TLP-20 [Parapoynx stagnalis nucleopolyhedrovirus]|uniref:TLP-20 n=1 Tax=Parapoynx stagnalis nucleopolyhedrovirus TaxID=2993413 RepID=A0A9E7Y5S1_9ABAC|nr:TLP-20 [Parapoynx stagnalis nucleopolyhedrovirus]